MYSILFKLKKLIFLVHINMYICQMASLFPLEFLQTFKTSVIYSTETSASSHELSRRLVSRGR